MKNKKEYEIIERPTILEYGHWKCVRKCKFESIPFWTLIEVINKGGYTVFECSDAWQDSYNEDSPIRRTMIYNKVSKHYNPFSYAFSDHDTPRTAHLIIANIRKILVRENQRKDEMIIIFRCAEWFNETQQLTCTIVARKQTETA